jgi:hypothetical protein
MASKLEYFMNYDSVPLSKRINTSTTKLMTKNITKEIRGRDVNWRSGINTIDPETGYSPLMVAVIQGKKDIAAALIERGAEVEQSDANKGRTPLQIAAREGQLGVLLELLKRDALVNSVDSHRKTSLMHAAKCGK